MDKLKKFFFNYLSLKYNYSKNKFRNEKRI